MEEKKSHLIEVGPRDYHIADLIFMLMSVKRPLLAATISAANRVIEDDDQIIAFIEKMINGQAIDLADILKQNERESLEKTLEFYSGEEQKSEATKKWLTGQPMVRHRLGEFKMEEDTFVDLVIKVLG